MSTINQQLLTLFEEYKENSDKFAEKGNKAAGTRARKVGLVTKLPNLLKPEEKKYKKQNHRTQVLKDLQCLIRKLCN